MKRAARVFLIAACVLCAGCATTPKRDATAALIQRKDFNAAANASPTWVSAALQEITRLEAELQRNGK